MVSDLESQVLLKDWPFGNSFDKSKPGCGDIDA
jgi:hypothetical protein